MSFRALPALKEGTLAAAIWIGAPVCGLRPVRAARSFTLKEPKPTSATELPDFKDEAMASVIASIARAAAAFGKSAVSATASINSDLFTLSPYYHFRLSFMEYLTTFVEAVSQPLIQSTLYQLFRDNVKKYEAY